MDKKSNLALKKLSKSRQALLKAIASVVDEDIHSVPIEGVWTIKDLLSHITSWDLVTLIPLRHFVENSVFDPEPIPDHLTWNDEQAKMWKGKPLATVMQDLEMIRQEIVNQAEQLSDSQWEIIIPAPWGGEGSLTEILGGLAWHENEHVKSILRWRKDQLNNQIKR
jgi:uncharacterized damage-inducible protein DinB